MQKIIALLVLILVSSCTHQKLKKPFIIIDKGYPDRKNNIYYIYQDTTGNRGSFYENGKKYDIGDTIH